MARAGKVDYPFVVLDRREALVEELVVAKLVFLVKVKATVLTRRPSSRYLWTSREENGPTATA